MTLVLGSHFPQHKTRFTGIQVVFNPWGSESMYSMGGVWPLTPPEKSLRNRYRVEMYFHSPNFQGQLKKN